MYSRRLGVFLAAIGSLLPLTRTSAAENVDVVRNLAYREIEGESLLADVYLPKGADVHPAVLVVHGGAWTFGNKSHLAFAANQMAERGLCAVAINYRLAPKHKFPAQLEDCRAAVAWLRSQAERFHIDRNQIGAFGYSAGGHLVTLLGAGAAVKLPNESPSAPADCHLCVVAAGGTPCDFCTLPPEERTLAFWLGGSRKECPELYQLASPAQHVSAACPPTFFFHGEQDALAPLGNVKRMSAQLTGAGVASEVFVVSGKGHTLAMFDQVALRRSIDFLKQHLEVEQPKEN